MGHPETILERTDRMLSVIASAKPDINVIQITRARDVNSLWQSSLGSSLMFSVDEAPLDATAEREAQNIVSRYLQRQHYAATPVVMSQMVDFQNALQMRSKVISAIETLMRV
jgi:hypothetical protein